MKKLNIIKGIAAVMLAGSMASCSSDYLDLTPIGNLSAEEVATEPSALRSGAYGAMQSMYRQYATLYDYLWFNGEPWFNMVYGEAMGVDFNNYFISAQTRSGITNWSWIRKDSWPDAIPWRYAYGIIAQCNNLLGGEAGIEEAGEMDGELAFRYAQLHAMRAYGYIRLHQLYGPRWADSNNGEVLSVIKRTAPTTGTTDPELGYSTTNVILGFIYEDLDRAIELMELSEFDREYDWEVNLPIVYGLYARAALLKDDWKTAQEMAHNASEGFDIMTGDEYKAGFASPTSEWMWATMSDPTGIYYASFGASYACNGAYPILWGSYGAGGIDYTLYKQVQNSDDARCDLYFTPDKVSRAHRGLFWNSDNVSSASMNINLGGVLSEDFNKFAQERYAEVNQPGWVFPYCDGDDYYEGASTIGESTVAIFGAQFKFWGTDAYASSNYCLMRASEMKLIEAEAACNRGLYSVAQDCLYDVNSKRIKNYTKSSKTGDDLLDEIKLYRRFELLGEGFNWFDMKRWNQPFERIAWQPSDAQSGSYRESDAQSFSVTDMDGWKFPIPMSETDYNDMAN